MYQQDKRLWFFGVITLCFSLAMSEAAEPRKYAGDLSWSEGAASLALMNGDVIVWQFNHLQDGKEKGAPYFHPLAALDGAVLTALRPGDHLWHRGLRFAWKKINGLEGYWTWPDGKKKWPDKKMGHTDVVTVKVTVNDDFSARFDLELSYHPPGEPADLTEKRVITVSAPDENGNYQIDWHAVFTAGAKGAVLDRTPIEGEPDGKWFGGYAGLQFRLAGHEQVAAWTISNSEGAKVRSEADKISKVTRKSLQPMHGKPARWVDLYLDGEDGKNGGVVIMDHPGNFRHPSPWHVAAMPHEFHHAPLFEGPFTLDAGKKMHFDFRIVIHPDRADKIFLEKRWKGFSARPVVDP
ncbi:MAG: PmoA family protein [Verrucomicrobiota bacterium]